MIDEYIRLTAITRLAVDAEQHQLLEQTVSAWQRGCQLAVAAAWPQYRSQCQLQFFAYDTIHEETEQGSQHAILAIHQAAETLGGCG